MKILLVGAHGTGKTTLAKEIQKLFPNYAIIDGIHRKAKQDGFKINETDDVISQIETVRRYLQRVGTEDNFISVDNIIRQTAYTISNNLPEPVIGLMKELCYIERANFTNAVFYIPIEFSLEKDSVRSDDIEFQKRVDVEIRNLLNIYYAGFYYKLTGTVDRRVNKVCELSKMI